MRHILIADDHEITRRGVREILLEAFPGLRFSEADSTEEIHKHLAVEVFDLLLLDMMMPGDPILETLAKIRAGNAEIPILILTGATEIEYVVQTMQGGANGLIHKHRASADLLEAVTKVAGGGTYLHVDSAIAIANNLREEKARSVHEALSKRELEVFVNLARGLSIKEIASAINLSEKTVATYLARIREKTGMMTYVEIARYALLNGLVD